MRLSNSSFSLFFYMYVDLPSDSIVGRGVNPILERGEGLITGLMECVPTLLKSHILIRII